MYMDTRALSVAFLASGPSLLAARGAASDSETKKVNGCDGQNQLGERGFRLIENAVPQRLLHTDVTNILIPIQVRQRPEERRTYRNRKAMCRPLTKLQAKKITQPRHHAVRQELLHLERPFILKRFRPCAAHRTSHTTFMIEHGCGNREIIWRPCL